MVAPIIPILTSVIGGGGGQDEGIYQREGQQVGHAAPQSGGGGGGLLSGLLGGAGGGGAAAAAPAEGAMQATAAQFSGPAGQVQSQGGFAAQGGASPYHPASQYAAPQGPGWAAVNSPEGMDFSGQGAAEQAFANTQGAWSAPTQSQAAYDQFAAGPHDFSPYFERAEQRALGSMNDQAAARGAYGTSQTMNNLQDISVAMNAERAGREADYNLQRGQLAGQLAGQADSQRFGQLMGFQQAAGQAQDAHRMRGRDYISDLYTPAMTMAGMTQQGLDQAIADDQAAVDAIMGLQMGAAGAALDESRYVDQLVRGDFGAGAATVKQVFNPIGI